MRLKVLSLFLAVQLFSFGIWNTLNNVSAASAEQIAQGQVHPAPTAVSASVVDASQELSELSFQTRNMEESRRFLNSIRQNQIETALKKLPAGHVASVKNIILDYDSRAHRGLGGNSMIILRAVDMDTEELVGVLIHEMGHNVDYKFLSHTETRTASAFKDGDLPVYESDLSLDFYRISWQDDKTLLKTAVNTDFVSGYAMSDPFEDFAETYAYYVLHNRDFKVLSASSDTLYAKYRFMKYEVFDGVEFDTGEGLADSSKRPWDVTVLDYDLTRFLG